MSVADITLPISAGGVMESKNGSEQACISSQQKNDATDESPEILCPAGGSAHQSFSR